MVQWAPKHGEGNSLSGLRIDDFPHTRSCLLAVLRTLSIGTLLTGDPHWRPSRLEGIEASRARGCVSLQICIIRYTASFEKDEWGPWLETSVPVNDPDTGAVSMKKVLRTDPKCVDLIRPFPSINKMIQEWRSGLMCPNGSLLKGVLSPP